MSGFFHQQRAEIYYDYHRKMLFDLNLIVCQEDQLFCGAISQDISSFYMFMIGFLTLLCSFVCDSLVGS